MVSPVVWILTIVGIVGLLAFDYVFHVRKAHEPTLREAAVWSAIYVGIAVVFGLGVLAFGGGQMGAEYFAGYLTEKALSVDNLFVFLIIMTSFAVPRADQQKVLLFGITFALIARSAMIFIGAALLDVFVGLFYVFGLFLIFTAVKMLRPESEDEHASAGNNAFVRLAKRFFHTSPHYDGDKLFIVEDGKRMLTPMLLVMIAIGGTDIMFALDSIPAIFGLTNSTYIVFTATAFSLMGLRQLYFLIDGLLDRLIYLSFGLAAILGFIGVKLIMHAAHEMHVAILVEEQRYDVPEVPIGLSLTVIVVVLLVTILASILSPAGRAQTAISNARHHAQQYLSLDYYGDDAVREANWGRLHKEIDAIRGMKDKHRAKIHDERDLMELLERAQRTHEQRVADGLSRESRGEAPAGSGLGVVP